jgi:hypothetical protein
MAENSFSRLGTPTAPRAEVNRVGPGWGVEATHGVAIDPVLHLPLHDPRILAPAPELPAAPPPSEAQHRQALAAALATQAQADEQASRAAEGHERALRLVARLQTELASYSALDSDRFARTLDSLRDDDGFATVPSENEQLFKRERAKLDLEDAVGAEGVLLRELGAANTAAGNAVREAERLATHVLMHTAEQLADEYDGLLQRAEGIREVLCQWDQFSVGSHVQSGKINRVVLSSGMTALAKLRDTSSWRAAKNQLLANPQADVSIAMPTPKPAMEPMAAARAMAATYREPIPAQEYFARHGLLTKVATDSDGTDETP